eukprot:508973_1
MIRIVVFCLLLSSIVNGCGVPCSSTSALCCTQQSCGCLQVLDGNTANCDAPCAFSPCPTKCGTPNKCTQASEACCVKDPQCGNGCEDVSKAGSDECTQSCSCTG